jgi:two-component system chemotaxis response regulator CheB
LSGTLDDGTAGLHAIKQAGGVAVVQDPEECAYPGMPLSAIHHVEVDHVLPPAGLGSLLDRLVREPAREVAGVRNLTDRLDPIGVEPALAGTRALRQGPPPGTPSTFSCPECGGTLFESDNGDLRHYRCHVGHAYGEESLVAEQSTALEGALWSAVRALEEKARLAQRLADRVRARGMSRAGADFERTAREAIQGSGMIRSTLLQGPVSEALEVLAELAPERVEPHGRADRARPDAEESGPDDELAAERQRRVPLKGQR